MVNTEANIHKLKTFNDKYDKQTQIYLEELSRQSEGTTANSNIKEFVKLDKNGPLFFVSSKGFKRMYIDNNKKPHESCLTYNYKKPKILSNKNNTYHSMKPTRPIQSGEPCGFEGTFVGIKSTNGSSFTKIGYINDNGELEEYLESKIKDVKKCSSQVIEINNDTWNAFLKSNNKRKTSPCELNMDDSRKSLLDIENQMNNTIDKLKPQKKEDNVSNTELYNKSSDLQNQQNVLKSLYERSETLNAMTTVLSRYKHFFYQRLKWIVFILVFLLIGIYGVYRMLKSIVTIPNSWKANLTDFKYKSNDTINSLFNSQSKESDTINNNSDTLFDTNDDVNLDTNIDMSLDTNENTNLDPNMDMSLDTNEDTNVNTKVDTILDTSINKTQY